MPSKYTKEPVFAFTASGQGLLRELVNEVVVSEAFDIKIRQTPPPEKTKTYRAIWDTGATNTCITPKVVADLNLFPSGKTTISGVTSKEEVFTYFISLGLPNKAGFPTIRVVEAKNIQGADVLIGMDVINMGDLAISNFNNQTVFSFRMPSIEKIDFAEQIKQIVSENSEKPISSRQERNRKKREKREKRKKS
ncbi:MAG: hypothetical protein F4201_04285 [Nitrospira sp. SB0677_bin_15]|nr:hypothetical protein [Nitrospira sp. SB0661_bin_20]MYG40026.1 hypothetical protein [Nitrospira sp. SB0677_bin_15]MYH01742.1 hypothetical protein [Nitrospira sp. SB0675_bin_23]